MHVLLANDFCLAQRPFEPPNQDPMMPFQDLLYQHEDSTPQFDPADPSVIEHYFDDLKFLFIWHSISDHQEKKCAAVNYPCVVTEWLWKTAQTFSDPVRSYEDFKAEIIALYPEVTAAHEYTCRQFNQLVSDSACSPICSKAELGQYFHKFLLVSQFLISKGQLGTPEQSRTLMASFRPSLSIAICSQLERQFPDHFYDNPYNVDMIYNATQLVLVWQQAMPLIYAPRSVLPPVTPTLAPPKPYSPPLPSICILPPIKTQKSGPQRSWRKVTESDNILTCYSNTYMHHDNYSNLLPKSVLGLTPPAPQSFSSAMLDSATLHVHQFHSCPHLPQAHCTTFCHPFHQQ